MTLIHIKEQEIRQHLSWPALNEAIQEALVSTCSTKISESQPTCNQSSRTFTFVDHTGIFFTMPAYVSNYSLPELPQPTNKFKTLGCKLATFFPQNPSLPKPLPIVQALILLFDAQDGQLICILDGTEITAWRTAAASIVGTKHLYFNRGGEQKDNICLGIIGSSVQGRIHAIGMCTTFNISKIHLWNRTKMKAERLQEELNSIKNSFINKNLEVTVFDSVDECQKEADIIVTATNTDDPLVRYELVKKDVHINAVGCGRSNQHSELDMELYSHSKIYVDSMQSANNDLKGLKKKIEGDIGELIIGARIPPKNQITIFHNLGVAATDCVTAQLIYEAVMAKKR